MATAGAMLQGTVAKCTLARRGGAARRDSVHHISANPAITQTNLG